jgi:DNA-binding MarR family transcriptional regulator
MESQQPILTKADYESLAAFRNALRRFLHFSEQAARAEGLTPQQHQLLLAIKGQPGREWASVTDLAEALQIRHNAAVGLVDRCVSAGLVQRAVSQEDRRQVQITLTGQGEQMIAKLSRRNQAELRALRQALQVPFLK